MNLPFPFRWISDKKKRKREQISIATCKAGLVGFQKNNGLYEGFSPKQVIYLKRLTQTNF